MKRRPKKTCIEMVRNDLKTFNLIDKIFLDRIERKSGIHVNDPS